MSEIRNQLICYLQELIAKRLAENRSTSASNLVGIVSQFKEFREWLQNNFRHDIKLNLLQFIQENSHYFQYDFTAGTVTNGHSFQINRNPVLASIVFKPKLINDLETDQSMDKTGDKLFVLELVIFIVQKVVNQSTPLSDLIESIAENCEKQFDSYKSMVKIEEKNSGTDMKEKTLIQLTTTYLQPIFSYNSSQKILTIGAEVSQIFESLTKTCLIVIRNCLMRQLYRFGRKYSYDLNDWFANNYGIAVEFMSNRGLTLDLIIGLHPEIFDVQNVDQLANSLPIVNLNPKIIGEMRSLEFELMYKYGNEIRGGIGVITKVTENSATIESEIDFAVNDQNFRPTFKVITELVKVFGQEICDLQIFVHSGDRISFDVKFITTSDDMKSENSCHHLWLVSRIYNVRHTANCYVHSIFDHWKYGNWDNDWFSSKNKDSDSSYDRFEEHTSGSD